MNPYYNRYGEFDRKEAFKDLIKMTNRWGGQWALYFDPRDKDYHTFGASRRVPARWIRIATARGIPAQVFLDTSTSGSAKLSH